MADSDDVARRKFLGALVDELGDAWSVGYAEVKPFGVLGATLRCEGVDGFVTVVPSLVENNVISWKPFPDGGRPHYDIKPDGHGGLRTCILADAVAIVQKWARAKQPLVRGAAESMLPVMRPILEAIAAAPMIVVEDAIDAKEWSVTPAGAKQLADALDGIDREAIARAFPRDDTGRVIATRALLAPIASSRRVSAGRDVFLAVTAVRVKGNDGLRLELVDANDVNETHRWMDARHLWREGVARPEVDARARECLALLDAGEFDAALAMYGIALEARTIKVLEGVPTSSGSRHEAESRDALRRVLWTMAPWRMAAVRWGSLALLPHQRGQVKGWISWLPPSTIVIEGSASNMRLARASWARDIDDDLARLGIARSTRTAAPVKKKAVAKKPQKPLFELLAGKDLWSATTALKHAKARPWRDSFAELVAIADSEASKTDRANALWVAIEIADKADGETFARFLGDRHDEVRRMAIDGVKKLGYTTAVPTLAQIVCRSRKSKSYEGSHAATAMKVLSGTTGPSGLVPYFASDDPRVREAACHAFELFHQGQELARPHLEKALRDDDSGVVSAAKAALAAIAKR